MTFVIRTAIPSDAPVACAVLRRSIEECCIEDHKCDAAVLSLWLQNKTPENLRSWFESSRGYAVVAEREGRIVGTAMLGGNGTITLCYLVPEARFLGIGKAMLSALEDEARRRGVSIIELGSTKTAAAFYRRNGYVETGKTEAAFGLTSKRMQKDIVQPAAMSSRLELLDPTDDLKDSYRALVAEYVAKGESFVPFTVGFPHDDFDAMLKSLSDCSRGIGVPTGFVPHSTFWLVRDDHEVVGVANIRHLLTPKLRREGGNIGYGIRPSARGRGLGTEILRHALRRAKNLGLKEVLITCGKTNLASVKVILRNGGLFDSEEYVEERGEIVQRYWIKQF